MLRKKEPNLQEKIQTSLDPLSHNHQNKKRKRRLSSISLLLMALFLLCGSVYFIFFYNAKAYERQGQEEDLALKYIDYLVEHASEIEQEQETTVAKGTEGVDVSDETTEYPTAGDDGIIHMSETSFTDDLYYERDGITFTPDYAQGYLFCVLEYPAVGIRRGVYSGTWDDIYLDLDMWMVTMARPDMQLGKTHLAIYGHNHTSQNLSFNNLKNAAVGDEFYLYAESGIYTYEVVNIFSDWRTDTTSKYIDDFSIGADVCYIITCGRDNFLIGGEGTRYKDFLVEGHLTSRTSLSDYAKERLTEEENKKNDIS
jgi:LPXTG-site transpeptidase (sortase) family protein